MRATDALKYALTILLVIAIVLLLIGQLLGQPMLVFVETGSMEPTLEPGDGYLAIPMMFSGEISEGDVILFDAEVIGDGGLTTHRVEEVTDEGYVTQGDANPFTDQDGGEPLVVDGQIRSVGVEIGGNLVTLPGIGGAVVAITDVTDSVVGTIANTLGFDAPDSPIVGMAILVSGLLLLVFSHIGDAGTALRTRVRRRKGLLQNIFVVIAIFTLVVIIPVNFSMLLPSGVYSFEIVSSSSPSENPAIIQAGSSSDVTYEMNNGGHIPMISFLAPAGPNVEVQQEMHTLPRGGSVQTDITMHAPDETGAYQMYVREDRYLMILPPSLIQALHNIHPFVAIGVINLFVITVISILSFVFVGGGRDRSRSRSRSRKESILERLFP